MFSQWRHTIENLAHSPKSSQDAAAEGSPLDAALRQSISSSSQLADAAISNLRKTLQPQRSGSPGPRSPPNDAPVTRSRVTLEDRLRAKFAIGDASSGTSPNPSTRSTPLGTPTPVTDHPLSPSPAASVEVASAPKRPLSPASIPLPPSPDLAPSIEAPQPVSAISSQPLESLESAAAETNETTHEHDTALPEGSPDLSEPTPAEDVVASTQEEHALVTVSLSSPDGQSIEEHQDASLDTTLHVDETELSKPENPPQVEIPTTSSPLDDTVDPGYEPPAETSLNEDPLSQVTESEATDIATEEPDAVDDPSLDPVVHEDVSVDKSVGPDIEGLRERLKLVEQRFTDVSTSFKRLQAEKAAVDRLLQEMTPVQSIQETEALRDFLQNMNLKTEMAQDEIKRLNGKLTRQEERIEELRDTHRLESKSQNEQIHKLQAQVEEAEALLKATQNSAATLETESHKRATEVTRLQGELDKIKITVKEEEEKRVKAIGLLKTVRQKLVKTERERDDATKESHALHAKEKEEREKEKAERQKLQGEVDKAKLDRELAVQSLKIQSEKELAALKESHAQELAALRGQFELEFATAKSLHTRELETRDKRISELESASRTLSTEKADLFDQLQMRQAELESLQAHVESLQSQNVEAQYQLREATDRIGLLNDELVEARQNQVTKTPSQGPSTEEVTRLLSAAEAKYEGRIADLRRQLATVESERVDVEAEFSKKLAEKVKEIEKLKIAVSASSKDQQEEKGIILSLKDEISSLQEQAQAYQQIIEDLRVEAGKVSEVESAAQNQIAEANAKISAVQQQLEEHKAREAQLRTHNKTLREELRKVQSSAALLERQRNPGLGYWASRADGSEARSPTSSVTDLAKESPPRPASPSTSLSDEEVNFEYLRNVIMQFLEHKEMRPHLVRILSTILHFTPQETRRLVAKV